MIAEGALCRGVAWSLRPDGSYEAQLAGGRLVASAIPPRIAGRWMAVVRLDGRIFARWADHRTRAPTDLEALGVPSLLYLGAIAAHDLASTDLVTRVDVSRVPYADRVPS